MYNIHEIALETDIVIISPIKWVEQITCDSPYRHYVPQVHFQENFPTPREASMYVVYIKMFLFDPNACHS